MKAVLVVCLASSIAYADEAPVPSEPPPAAPPATAPAGSWAQIDTRPLLIPADRADVHGNLGILSAGNDTAVALGFGADYGLNEKMEIGGDYAGIRLTPDATLKGAFDFHLSYHVLGSDKLELAVTGGIGLVFVDVTTTTGNPPMTTTSTNAQLALEGGAQLRYHLAPKFSLFTGLPAIPPSAFGLPGLYQLRIGLNNSAPIALSLPAGIGWQAAPQVYAYAAINLATIVLNNGSSSFLFADNIPLGIGALFSVNDKLDVGVQFNDDFENFGGAYVASLIGRYYVK